MTTSGWCDLFSQDMFGLESDTIHPFLSFSGEYTDNVFATNDDEEDDLISYITPGVWLALPGADAEVINIAASSSVPGGMAQTRFQNEEMGRYQGFFRYAPTFENYLDIDDRDFIYHRLDAYAALNLAGGLSFELMDQYQDSRDDVEEETDSAEFNNNLLALTTSYAITDKLKARVDLGYYDVNYNSDAPEKDRKDISVSGFVLFDIRPKTTIFGEMSHTDIDYDTANVDSTEFKVFAGVKYDASDRINAMGKIGYVEKDLDELDETDDTLGLEAFISYDLSDRIDLSANAKRGNQETTTSRFVTESVFSVSGTYSLTSRISSTLYLAAMEEEYKKIDRDDSTYKISPSVKYQFNNRIFGSLAYMYTDRDASGQDTSAQSDYTENSVMLTITASM
ncbi:outer membrane beta-barrel protein [Desulfoluna butyratoxydans]|nr:outer membrane beta-barrel protein [Desulfoluna butyratoxydans]